LKNRKTVDFEHPFVTVQNYFFNDSKLSLISVMPPLHAVPPVKLTRCLKMRSDANSRQLIGAFRPQCTESGEFLPMQCHSSTGECWCVDKNGDEVVGTMRQAPDQPSCTGTCINLH